MPKTMACSSALGGVAGVCTKAEPRSAARAAWVCTSSAGVPSASTSAGRWDVDEQKACSWRRHDPLVSTAHGAFQSYESVARPGAFLSTHGSNVTGAHRLGGGERLQLGTLKPLVLARKPPPPPPHADRRFEPPSAFALESSFEEAAGEAEYPPTAFWLGGGGGEHAPSALLYPLNEVVDEHYSVYWDLARP